MTTGIKKYIQMIPNFILCYKAYNFKICILFQYPKVPPIFQYKCLNKYLEMKPNSVFNEDMIILSNHTDIEKDLNVVPDSDSNSGFVTLSNVKLLTHKTNIIGL